MFSILRKNSLVIAASMVVSIVISALLLVALALWWQFQPTYEPVRSINPQSHNAFYAGSGSIGIYREFQVLEDTTMTVKRELVQVKKDGTMIRVELPATIVAYKTGFYKTARMMEIPQTIKGKFILHSELCWQQNPLKESCMILPLLQLDIPEQV